MRTKEELEDEIYYQKDNINKKQYMIDLFNADINKYNSELKSLEKELEELKKKELEELNKPKRFNPKNDMITDVYYYISEGNIVSTRYCNTYNDRFNFKTRNCFKTKEEAEEELERILFVNEVRDFIEEENDGWVPDFDKDRNFYLVVNGNVLINTGWGNKHTSSYKYFKSREIGEKILAKFDNQKLIKYWI